MTNTVKIRKSIHEARIYFTFTQMPDQWLTSVDIEEKAVVSGGTSRNCLKRLADAGILESMKTFGGFRYRLVSRAKKSPLVAELEQTVSAFGLDAKG